MKLPNTKEELTLFKKGYQVIAGIDEAGRGPIAGPVVAGIVIITKKHLTKLRKLDINDSKKLSPAKREKILPLIKRNALGWSRGVVSEKMIDKIGIRKATFLAMKKALKSLKIKPQFILIDGKDTLRDLPLNQKAIVNGDEKVMTIAAASILAKETRDDIMRRFHKKSPKYNFAQHKGYGTKEHLRNLKKFGPSKIHRFSFSPLKKQK